MLKLMEFAVGGAMAYAAVSGAEELMAGPLAVIERALSMPVGF